MDYFEKFTTKLVQEIGSKDGAISPIIANSASFGYGNSQNGEDIFAGISTKFMYARSGNPTATKLETILSHIDNGEGALATASGMAAITAATMSLLKSGDEVISIGGLFGGTYSFFSETLARFGIKTYFFDVDDFKDIENSINDNTKIIFLESVGNPNMRLPDFGKISDIANRNNIALIVDNTLTPLSITPLNLGADIVVYSTTKIVTGNASALGGAVIFRSLHDNSDKFLTNRYKELDPFIKKSFKNALIINAKKRAMRDFGLASNAFTSYLTLLGLETLPLRVQRVVKSVEKIVYELDKAGFKINHPSLINHPQHKRYKEQFQNGCGMLFTIDFGSKQRAFEVLDKLKLIFITANVGDSRTLALHMDSTIYSDFTQKEKKFLGITPGLVRVSVGLENPDDIIKDFLQASNV